MKILFAGLGSIGRRHLRHLQALGDHQVLLYRTGRGTLPDDELAGLPVETDLSAALAHQPDAVVIANPTALHLDVALPAAQAGCHILLEKPVSHTLDGLDELAQVVAAQGVQVLVGFQFRYHPGLQHMRQILASGELGRPISVRAHWGEYLPNWHPWEDYRQSYSARKDLGGGVLLTLTHPLDYLRYLLGDVQSLAAFTGQLSDLELDQVEDTAEISLHFSSGALGSVHLDYNQRPARHQIEVVCTNGTLRWDQNADGLDVYAVEAGEWQRRPWSPDFERDHLFRAQMAHFLDVVAGTASPVCSLQDGIWALRLALAAHQANQEGRTVNLL